MSSAVVITFDHVDRRFTLACEGCGWQGVTSSLPVIAVPASEHVRSCEGDRHSQRKAPYDADLFIHRAQPRSVNDTPQPQPKPKPKPPKSDLPQDLDEPPKRKPGRPRTREPEPKPGRPRGERNHNAVLNAELVKEIRDLHAKGLTQKAIAGRVGVSQASISMVLRGKTWTHVE